VLLRGTPDSVQCKCTLLVIYRVVVCCVATARCLQTPENTVLHSHRAWLEGDTNYAQPCSRCIAAHSWPVCRCARSAGSSWTQRMRMSPRRSNKSRSAVVANVMGAERALPETHTWWVRGQLLCLSSRDGGGRQDRDTQHARPSSLDSLQRALPVQLGSGGRLQVMLAGHCLRTVTNVHILWP